MLTPGMLRSETLCSCRRLTGAILTSHWTWMHSTLRVGAAAVEADKKVCWRKEWVVWPRPFQQLRLVVSLFRWERIIVRQPTTRSMGLSLNSFMTTWIHRPYTTTRNVVAVVKSWASAGWAPVNRKNFGGFNTDRQGIFCRESCGRARNARCKGTPTTDKDVTCPRALRGQIRKWSRRSSRIRNGTLRKVLY